MKHRNILQPGSHRRSLTLATAHAQTTTTSSAPSIVRLEKRGAATQLMVDGKPFLVLGGETDNTASSGLEYMDTVWPQLVKMNLNTVLVGVGWDWVEPVEGRYDSTLVDGLLDGAPQEQPASDIPLVWQLEKRPFPASRPNG